MLMGSGLQTGAVLNRVFEIHESHIPYLLQFKVSTVSLRSQHHKSGEWSLTVCLFTNSLTSVLPEDATSATCLCAPHLPGSPSACAATSVQIDFNLYGMGFIRVREVLFRDPVPQHKRLRHQGWQEPPTIMA